MSLNLKLKKQIFSKIKQIPKGKVTTYKELAKAIKCPKAYRFIGNVIKTSPGMPFVPCHRVVKQDGTTGKYNQKKRKKIKLLKNKGIKISKEQIIDFKKVLYKFKGIK